MRQSTLSIVALALLIGGCQSRLNVSKTVELAHGEITWLTVDGPRYDQKIAVEFSAPSPISVVVCLKKDEATVKSMLEAEKIPEQVIAKQEQVKSGTLEYSAPATTETVVFLFGAPKPTSVSVKIAAK